MELEKLVVTVSEAAAMTSVGRSTAYALVARGEWPSITVGRCVRVPVEALRAWVDRRMASGAKAPAAASLQRSAPRRPARREDALPSTSSGATGT